MPRIDILNIDCLEYMHRTLDKAFDLAIVDPPYMKGFAKMGYWGKKSSSKGVPRGQYSLPEWDEQLPTHEYFQELIRVSKEQIIWGINYFDINLGPGRIVWDKVTGDGPLSACELAYCSLHDSTRMIRYMWNGFCQGKSLKEGHIMQGDKRLNEVRIHPTQKPILLYKWLLHKYAKPGWKILDTHLGSGSIAIACEDLGYSLVGCEINQEYAIKAIHRHNNHRRQAKLFSSQNHANNG